ncbi:unnamed protein product [Penicillium bialowiezense]
MSSSSSSSSSDLAFVAAAATTTTAQRVCRDLDLAELGALLLLLLLLLAAVTVVHPLEQLLNVGSDDEVEDDTADNFGPALAAHLRN